MTAQLPAVPKPPDRSVVVTPTPVPAAKRPKQLNARHVIVSALAGVVIVLLAGVITYLFTKPHGSSEWADVIRSIVLAVAAMGAVPAAYVAYRKQQTTEAEHQLEQDKLELEQAKEDRRQQELTDANDRRLQEIDAANQRADRLAFSERFTVVSNQIGSDKAPVRLAGVYAMAQLADEWGRVDPPQRQTCIDVLCAYLRMPWPADHADAPAALGHRERAGGQRPYRRLAGRPVESKRLQVDPTEATALEETRVRETILQVIAAHVNADRQGDHWHANRFDLRGAVLPDHDFSEARFETGLQAAHTTFTSHAEFDGTFFGSSTLFSGAVFAGGASFDGATFVGDAGFTNTTFVGDASFGLAAFAGGAWFGDAVFGGDANFREATFHLTVVFGRVEFSGFAIFRDASCLGGAVFNGSRFEESVTFAGASFSEAASFGEAVFLQPAVFIESVFLGAAYFGGASMAGRPWFKGAVVSGDVIDRGGSTTTQDGQERPLGPLLGFLSESEPDGDPLPVS